MKIREWLVAAFFLGNASVACAQQRHIAGNWPWNTIPHVVDGAYWSTTITVVNLSSKVLNYDLVFMGDDGKPAQFDLIGIGKSSERSGQMPASGSITFRTSGTSSTLNQGWAMLGIIGTDYGVGITAIFTHRVPGQPGYEAAALASDGVEGGAYLPYDNTSGYSAGVAILNPDSFLSSTIPIDVLDEQGAVMLSDKIQLAAGNKTSFAVSDRWPQTANRRGMLRFGAGVYPLALLGLRFAPDGAFATVPSLEP